MTVISLSYYPVKSMRGIHNASSLLTYPRGFEYDRCWLIADTKGNFITGRTYPQMVAWQAIPDENGLTLISPQGDQRYVSLTDYQEPHSVKVWRDEFQAYNGPEHTDQWLSEHLGFACRLFYLGSTSRRHLGFDGSELSFADGAPYLLTTTASLNGLNDWLAEAVDMRRFRPNIVIDSEQEFTEEQWKVLQIGEAVFENFKPCTRCELITVDPNSGLKDDNQEPLQTLSQIHNTLKGPNFGVNLIVRKNGLIKIGDPAEIIERF